jgi:predicted DNA-binding protein
MTTVTSTYSLDLETVMMLAELANVTEKAKSALLREMIKAEHERVIGTEVAEKQYDPRQVAGLS